MQFQAAEAAGAKLLVVINDEDNADLVMSGVCARCLCKHELSN